NICSFDLNEVCRTEIELLRNPEHDLMSTLTAPDFSTGGELILDRAQMEEIYRTGRGSFRVRAKWTYLKKDNLIEVTEIPYTTTIEAIIDKTTELIKAGKVREISDMRDETGLQGLKIAIDLKRGVDPDKLMQKLMKMTPLCDTFSCNFNILIGGVPRVMGVREILEEWTAWREECVRRKVYFDMNKKEQKLHLLRGLKKILLDIDRAIAIIRGTEEDAEVVPNLMIGFGIDEPQADFIAEIKLRNINKEHILKRLAEVEQLEREIKRLKDILADRSKLRGLMIADLEGILKRFPTERHTTIVHEHEVEQYDASENIEDYPVSVFLTRDGYFKKITPLSLRMGGEQKLKDGDELTYTAEATNKAEIIFLSSAGQAYKARLHEFDDSKASVLGDYLLQKLGMDEGEVPIFAFLPGDYKGSLIYVFQNGKAAKIECAAFETKSNRRKLTGSYSDKSPLIAAFHLTEEEELAVSTGTRLLIFNTAQLAAKTTRGTQGVAVMTLKKNATVKSACRLADSGVENPARYRTRTLPAAGALLRDEDLPEKQLTL
ncbi:MAG: topoisomerase IV, partial [Clostridia bacterium]|nr:topoisomerase IV [Clostridia bacterium]